MATIVLQFKETQRRANGAAIDRDVQASATVSASPGRLHLATINRKLKYLERVGVDASGNEIYREQVGS